MTTLEKLVLGGLGAVTPMVVALVATDPAVLTEGITRLVFLGHVLRAAGLFFLGALIVFLYKDEDKRFKIFQLGLAAPALLTTMVTARQIEGSGESGLLLPARTQSLQKHGSVLSS